MKCVEKVPTFDCMKWDGVRDSGSHGWFKKRFASASVYRGELSVSWWNGKVFTDFVLPVGHWMVINELTGKPESMNPAEWRSRFEEVKGAPEDD